MPVRPENRHRYGVDWPEFSRSIRFERAEGRCECEGECGRGTHTGRCPNQHGEPAYGTGSKVVLTVAHLDRPAQLPFFFHVTGNAVTDEVVRLVGLLMPFDSKALERNQMMHDRAATEFIAGPPASGAGFFVALPNKPSSRSPARPIVLGSSSTAPVWILLSSWSESREPFEPALICAESSPISNVDSTDSVLYAAALASGYSESSLALAKKFVATGGRTSPPVIGGLLCSEREDGTTNNAGPLSLASSYHAHSALYHFSHYPEDREHVKAMCQGCHLHYDKAHHAETASRTRKLNANTLDMFNQTPNAEISPPRKAG